MQHYCTTFASLLHHHLDVEPERHSCTYIRSSSCQIHPISHLACHNVSLWCITFQIYVFLNICRASFSYVTAPSTLPLRFLSTARSQFLTEIFESFFGISDPDLKGVGRLRIRRLMADLPNSYLNRTLISKFQPIWVLLLFVTIYSLLYLILQEYQSNISFYLIFIITLWWNIKVPKQWGFYV